MNKSKINRRIIAQPKATLHEFLVLDLDPISDALNDEETKAGRKRRPRIDLGDRTTLDEFL